MRFLRVIFLVAGKDLRSELRSRHNTLTVLFFAIVVLVVFHFGFDLADVTFNDVGPGIIWVAVAFASLLGLQGSFAREAERQGLSGLLLSCGDGSAVYLGKALASLVTLLLAEAVFLPAAALLFGADIRPVVLPLAVVMAIHSIGLVAVGTLFAAMAVRIRRGQLLLPVLQLSVNIPLLMSAVRATDAVLLHGTLEAAGIWLSVGVAYAIVFLTVAALLFEALIED